MKKNWNYFYNLYNAFVSHSMPVSLTHFVTEHCNARCPHCFVDLKNSEEELTLEQIEKIASTSGNALRNVSLTGGEPFIRDDIFEIASIWYKNSTIKSVALCTNGSMPDKIADFAKSADKQNLPVSFFFSYDFIEEKHSEYRKLKDLHKNVLESYKTVHKYFPKFNATFNLTVTPDNYKSAYNTYIYIRDVLKVQNINCTLIRGSIVNSIDYKVKKDIADTYKLIQSSLDEDFDNGKVKGYPEKSLTSILLNAKNKMLWKYVAETFEKNKYFSPCRAGALFGVIYSKGDIFPCELLNTPIANLSDFDYNFYNCWNSKQAKKIRENIVKSKCFCTFECSWLINLFSSPVYYPELLYTCYKNNFSNVKNKKNNE